MIMQDLIQLGLNSIGAIAGVALTFYFVMPLFNGLLEQIRALTKSTVQHEMRAEARHMALLVKIDNMQDQHVESFKSLGIELAESKKVIQDIYTYNLARIRNRKNYKGGVE